MNFPKPDPILDKDFQEQIRQLPCVVCCAAPRSTVSHIKTRGSGGDDSWFNCTPKCGKHHMEWESSAPSDFFERWPHFKEYLFSLGWYIDDFGKLRHPEYEKGSK